MPKLFWRILITASAAGGAFLLTSVLKEDDGNIWQWVASIVLGSAALIVQYLVDFGERLQAVEDSQRKHLDEMKSSLTAHHGEMSRAVDDSFSKINAATELFSRVDGSVLRSDEVTRLVRAYTEVGDQGSDIVKSFAEQELGDLAQLMEDLSNGISTCPGENNEWLVDLTMCVKKTLYATSTSVDRDFWSSEPAKRYLTEQEKAKQRGVEIRRLFLVDEPDEVTDSLRQLCERHRTFGIDARIAIQSEVEPNAQLNDFIIFDGELCHETEPDVRGRPARTTLRMTRHHVEERVSHFNRLWDASPSEN
ncbi:DUF6879 family protein [Streptomyces sp. GESEQ-35]|uniref:DUF6879 family protein n=1 Tax=Streptomyces sp. GESEQ-35 TaxID=2812657 RepID=UPI001B324B85|nr:DUF6879 family protein [Streptomyces sp. GESEQ-35]